MRGFVSTDNGTQRSCNEKAVDRHKLQFTKAIIRFQTFLYFPTDVPRSARIWAARLASATVSNTA